MVEKLNMVDYEDLKIRILIFFANYILVALLHMSSVRLSVSLSVDLSIRHLLLACFAVGRTDREDKRTDGRKIGRTDKL